MKLAKLTENDRLLRL